MNAWIRGPSKACTLSAQGGPSPRRSRCTAKSLPRITGTQKPASTDESIPLQRRYPMCTLIGIDWSKNEHHICIVNEVGAQISRFSIPHSTSGISDFEAKVNKLGLSLTDCLIGLASLLPSRRVRLENRGYFPGRESATRRSLRSLLGRAGF